MCLKVSVSVVVVVYRPWGDWDVVRVVDVGADVYGGISGGDGLIEI
jgi:hypothetical protein